MAKGKRYADSNVDDALTCATCTVNMGEFGWKVGPVYHCEGSDLNLTQRRHGDPHHGRKKIYCPKCDKYLACEFCAGSEDLVGHYNPICATCRVDSYNSRIVDRDEAKELMHLVGLVLAKQMSVDEVLQTLKEMTP